MEQTTTKLSTFYEAQAYIASRYIFNDENYPPLRKFVYDKERRAFAVNHSLLHINKSLYGFLNEFRLVDSESKSLGNPDKLKEYSVKMLVNIIKLAEVMNIDKEVFDFGKKVTEKNWWQGDWTKFLLPISNIAAICEAYDHTGKFDTDDLLYAEVVELWLQFAGRVKRESFPWKMDELIGFIPEYMKSK